MARTSFFPCPPDKKKHTYENVGRKIGEKSREKKRE